MTVVPSPSWPFVLSPQVNNIPSDLIAMVLLADPVLTVVQLLLPTCTGLDCVASVLTPANTGVDLSNVVDTPNCPPLLRPHISIIPSVLMAAV